MGDKDWTANFWAEMKGVAGEVDAPPAALPDRETEGKRGPGQRIKRHRNSPDFHPSAAQSPAMTGEQYRGLCEKLGITVYGSGAVLGISVRMAHRYASNEWPVPETVAKLLRAMVKLGTTQVFGNE